MKQSKKHLLRLMTMALGSTVLFGALHSPTVDASSDQSKAHQNYPWQNEQAFYKVKINGADAVHAVLRVGKVSSAKNKPYVPVSANAQSIGIFKSIMEIDDRANTFLNPQNHQPYRSEKRFKERAISQPLKERMYRVDYNYANFMANVNKTINRTKKKTYVKAIPSKTHDGISWIFDLRTRKSFKAGEQLSYYIYDGWKLSRLDITVKKREKIFTVMGWRHAWKFDVKREVLNSRFQRKNRKNTQPKLNVRTPAKEVGSIWMTDDKQRLPVKLALEWKISKTTNMVAKVEVELVKYKRGKSKNKAAKPIKQIKTKG